MDDSLDSFFQAPETSAAPAMRKSHRIQPVKLDPPHHQHHAAMAALNPDEVARIKRRHSEFASLGSDAQDQAKRMRAALHQLEQQSQKMRDALHRLEGTQPLARRRTDGRANRPRLYERRRADRRDPEDPNQLYLFDEKFLQKNFAAPPADLPSAVDNASVENYAISLAYGEDGMGLVGTLLVALSQGDSNGDGIVDSQDVYPDQSPVRNVHLDLDKVREGMMRKVRELVARFDRNHNGRIDGPREAFEFLDHVAHIDFAELQPKRDPHSGMITSETFVEAFGDVLSQGLAEVNEP